MTPDQLRDVLQALAGHCTTLHNDLETSGLHAARTSQTGVRTGTTGSKLPCSAVDLDFIIEEVAPVIRGWCTELQRCARVTGLPNGWAPLNVWVAFLARNREPLLAQEWGTTAAQELSDLEYELRYKLHPKEPERPRLADFATAEELANATGRTTDAIRRWCKKHNVESWTVGGVKQYKTLDVL